MPKRSILLSFALGEPPKRAGSKSNHDVSPAVAIDSLASQEAPLDEAAETRADTDPAAHRSANGSETVAAAEFEGHIEVRPIGTSQGLKELSGLYKRTGGELGALERKVHIMLWPLALHFGLYWIRPGRELKRPPLVGAFWARSLAEAPLTLGHLYPPALFKGLVAGDVFEFGGMAVDPEFRSRDGLMSVLSDTVRLFLFSRRPELVIATPIESLHELYKSFGLRTLGGGPLAHPHVAGVKVYLMYGRFKELAEPFFM
ncbi:MAG: hypothetical protein WA005_14275 [Candidatus Binataceae bacterium]